VLPSVVIASILTCSLTGSGKVTTRSKAESFDFLGRFFSVWLVANQHIPNENQNLLQKVLQFLAAAGVLELAQGFRFNLPDSLSGDAKLTANFF